MTYFEGIEGHMYSVGRKSGKCELKSKQPANNCTIQLQVCFGLSQSIISINLYRFEIGNYGKQFVAHKQACIIEQINKVQSQRVECVCGCTCN